MLEFMRSCGFVLFASEGTIGHETDWRTRAAGEILQSLHRTIVRKQELSQKTKLSIHQSILFQPSPIVMSDGSSIKERDRGDKQPRWIFSGIP